MLKKRDSRIEAYRCFLMFGIVALHCAYVTLGSFTWENNVWKWCVDGFALIFGLLIILARLRVKYLDEKADVWLF